MHEFLLFGQIPSSRHDQVLNILSGVTASQPTSYAEQHLLYAQLQANPGNVNTKKRPQQQVNQQRYYHDLARSINGVDVSEPSHSWRLRINQEPEPGIQHFLSRGYTATEISDTSRYTDPSAFAFASQQIHRGHHFVLGNILFRVYRLWSPTTSDGPLSSPPPAMDQCNLFDTSGAYIVEASVRLEDRGNSKLADMAIRELLEAKKMLQGAIELYAPDRLSLDTRVKS